jgi:hypothetical protein
MPSSHPQNSGEPSGLLHTLLTAFSGVLFGLFLSKLRAPSKEGGEPVSPQEYTGEERSDRPFQPPIVTEIAPAPIHSNQTEWRKDDTPLWKKIAEWSIAAATVGLLFINIFQLGAAKKAAKAAEAGAVAAQNAADIAKRSLESTQRAFITFSPNLAVTGIRNKPGGDRIIEWSFSVPIENSGVTPTKGMHLHVDTVNYGFISGLPANFKYPDTGSKPTLVVLGPKQQTGSGQVDVLPDVIDAMKNQKRRVYFYGWARYRDVFPNTPEHVTKFCFEMTAFAHDAFLPSTENSYAWFSACPQHNCSDEDCQGDQ